MIVQDGILVVDDEQVLVDDTIIRDEIQPQDDRLDELRDDRVMNVVCGTLGLG